ncbi:MAG: hypothetical protein ACOCUS_03320 [Polyangiales bacterium]
MAVLVAAACSGCGDDGERSQPAQPSRQQSESADSKDGAEREQLYATDGSLLESDDTVAGLTLPKGLEPFREEERRHVYRTTVSLEKLQKYFGPRLMTGEVERIGEGVIYRDATARDAEGAKVHMDVKILPGVKGTRVEIEEIPPPPKNPPSLEELREKARNQKHE